MRNNNKKRKVKDEAHLMKPHGLTNKWRNYIIIGLIITFTFIIFCKAINFHFVLWDDNYYITDNLLIRDFSFDGLKKIFTIPILGMYNPLTFLIYALIYKFWGLNPSAFHFFNLLFHLVAIITVYNLIFRLTKRYETAAIVALLFAIHPMHVGVVTWVSQLKTSMYLIFYFLALINYLKYVQNNYNYKYLVYTALLFILSALSKPTAVTLFPMLFLFDYYLSRKLERKLFLEKIPFFIIAIFIGILTLYTHSMENDSIFESTIDYSFINNLLISNYSIVFYINKLFACIGICTIYPYPANETFLPFYYYLSIPIIPIVLFIVYKARKFRKELIFGILFFVIAISVLLRIVPSGFFGHANRYTYLSYTGLFFIMGQYFTYVLDNKFTYSKKIKKFLIVFLCLFIVFISYQTSVRINVWENSIVLFDDIIKKKPKFAGAYFNRALAKQDIGDHTGAMADYKKTIEYDAKHALAYSNLAVIQKSLNDENAALKNYNKALELNPKLSSAYNDIGLIMANRKKYNEAMLNFNSAIKFNPKYGPAFHNRGTLKIILGDTASAIEDWKKSDALGVKESVKQIEIFSSCY